MGSGHILVYAFDVLMQIYEAQGYTQRDAARLIVEKNLYGLDIDKRAYQLTYFAVMMKARQYNRRILNGEIKPHLYAIQDSKADMFAVFIECCGQMANKNGYMVMYIIRANGNSLRSGRKSSGQWAFQAG